jgi:Leucine-rich repeat (LRR) protein
VIALRDRLRALTHLNLKLTRVSMESILPVLPVTLQSLNVSGSIFGQRVISELMRMVSLTHLDLSECDLTHHIWLQNTLPITLQSLNLHRCNLPHQSINIFAKNTLPMLGALRYLDLSYCVIDLETAENLAKNLPQTITSLDLEGTGLTEGGTRYIADHLKRLGSLTYMNLSRNFIGNNGAISLAKALPKTLTSLDMYQCDLSDVGIQALVKALPAAFTSLNISSNIIEEENTEIEIANAIRKSMNKLIVIFRF